MGGVGGWGGGGGGEGGVPGETWGRNSGKRKLQLYQYHFQFRLHTHTHTHTHTHKQDDRMIERDSNHTLLLQASKTERGPEHSCSQHTRELISAQNT